MSENRLKGLVALLVGALLAVIAAGTVLGSRSAAGDLRVTAERALAAAGLQDVRVTFHGREAVLTGGNADDLGRAEVIVEDIEGVRWADVVLAADAPMQSPPATTPTLDLRRTGTGITISGTVPDADAAAGIKTRVAEDFGVPVTGDLVIDPAVGTAGWIDLLPDVFGDIVGVKRLELTIDGGGTLELAGSIESRAGVDDVRRLVAAAAPDLDVVSRMNVVPGSLPEADAAVLNLSTLYFGPRSSDLAAGHQRVLEAIADVLRRNPDVAIEAGGHTGPSNPAAGELLSLARLAAVKAYLVRSGVSAARINTRTFASDSRTSRSAAKQFRRVDFIVAGS